MKPIIKIFSLFLLVSSVHGQPLRLDWQRTYGGRAGDICSDAIQTSDSGFVLVGTTFSDDGDVTQYHGDGWSDLWVVKTDRAGTLQWQRALGGESNSDFRGQEFAWSVHEAPDGGVVVAGTTTSTDGDAIRDVGEDSVVSYDTWLIKLNTKGEVQWQHTYGGSAGELVSDVTTTADGGYILAIQSTSSDGDAVRNLGMEDLWVLKVDASGNIDWHRNYGSNVGDFAYEIINTSDGGYAIAGATNDFWLVKLDGAGELQWEQTYGGTDEEQAAGLIQSSDGGYVMVGYTRSFEITAKGNQNIEGWIVKVDGTGKLVWQRSMGGTQDDFFRDIIETVSGDFLVLGTTSSIEVEGHHPIGDDLWVVGLNSEGDSLWQKLLGGNNSDFAGAILQTYDGGYAIAGGTKATHDNEFKTKGDHDFWLMKLTDISQASKGPRQDSEQTMRAIVDPLTGNLQLSMVLPMNLPELTINIVDILGRIRKSVSRSQFAAGHNEIFIDINDLSSGIYVVTVISESYHASDRIHIVR